MGNIVTKGGKSKAKIVKLDGETFKLKLPLTAMDVLKDYPPGFVLFESETVKRFGIRAPKLAAEDELQPRKIYFLVEMPRFPDDDREINRPTIADSDSGSGAVRVKMRLRRAEVRKALEQSRGEAEVTEAIVGLCLQKSKVGFSDH